MVNYTWTLALIQPLFMIPFLAVAQCIRYLKGDSIAAPTVRVALWMALVAVLAFLYTVGQKYATRGDYVSGPIGVIAGQMGIVFIMFFSFIFLGTRYTWKHFLGAALVIVAVVVATIPQFEEVRRKKLLLLSLFFSKRE